MQIFFDFWHPSLPNHEDFVSKLPNLAKTVRFVYGDWWHQPQLLLKPYDADVIFWLSDEVKNCATHRPNNFFIVNGTYQSLYPTHNVYCPWLTWFDRVAWTNTYKASLPVERAFIFDALLGLDKWHRSFVFDRLTSSGLLTKSLVSIAHHADPNTSRRYESSNLHLYELPAINRVKRKQWARNNGWSDAWNSQDPVEGHDYNFNHTAHRVSWTPTVSVLIPERIYDACWYSIICETHFEQMHFLSEKTAKVLMAERIFVMFAAQGLLEFLRQQGYHTFHGIIDESYDQIENNTKRFEMAWQQVEYLASCDPVMIYQQAQQILQHNREKLLDVKARRQLVEKFMLDRLESI